jgi:RES domain-containing protein
LATCFEGTDALQENTRGGRWNPPDLAALYCSLIDEGARAEISYLASIQPVPISRPIVAHGLRVSLKRVADLKDLEPLAGCGITRELVVGSTWETAQKLGRAAAWLGCGGLLVPSARHDGINLVAFVNNLGTDDELVVV